jgi:GT2 family glycosyltransferase
MDHDVTISIVNHSNRALLLDTLRALERDGANRTSSAEVVVLDNASEDGSVEAVAKEFPEVRLIAQTHRAGFGANHNTVIRSTSGRYVLLLNDDAELAPGAIDTLVAYLDSRPAVAAAAPLIRGRDGQVQQTAWRFLTPKASLTNLVSLGKAGFVQAGPGPARRVERASGCVLLLRRAALDEIGLFDEGFFMYSEDSDLCVRLDAVGYEVHYVPEAQVLHHSQQSSSGVPDRRVAEHWRSQRRYWSKHHSRSGVRVAAITSGTLFAVRAAISAVLLALPERIRPKRAANWPPREFWLAARSAWFGPRGPGLRELADEWNQQHPTSASSPTPRRAASERADELGA